MPEEGKATLYSTTAMNTHAHKKEGKEDIIPYDEWVQIGKGMTKKVQGEYLLERNSKEAELFIPTVLRDKKISGNGNGNS